MLRFTILSILVSITGHGLMAKDWSRDDLKIARGISDEFRRSYKYDKATYETVRKNLDLLVDIQKVLREHEAEVELMKGLTKHRDGILNQFSNLDKKAVPYLIREHANLQIDRQNSLSSLSSETQKSWKQNLDSRIEAVEQALKTVGLNSIPSLSEFQALAARKKGKYLAARTKNLINEIVRVTSLENQKTQMKLIMVEATAERAEVQEQPGIAPEAKVGGLSVSPSITEFTIPTAPTPEMPAVINTPKF